MLRLALLTGKPGTNKSGAGTPGMIPASEGRWRNMGRLFLIAAGLAASVAVAGEPAIHREGAYWVLTLQGSEPSVSATRLRIRTRGPVQVTGTAQSEINYSLKVKVKARNEVDARRLSKEFGVHISRQGDAAVMIVAWYRHGGVAGALPPRAARDRSLDLRGRRGGFGFGRQRTRGHRRRASRWSAFASVGMQRAAICSWMALKARRSA